MIMLVNGRVGQRSSLDNDFQVDIYTYINKFVGGPRASEEFTSRCGGKVMNIGVGRVNSSLARGPPTILFIYVYIFENRCLRMIVDQLSRLPR